MTSFVKVARTSDIEPGQSKIVDVKGKQIALFNIDGELFALDNMCPHEEGSLGEGEIAGYEVTCPASYVVRVSGGDVEVDVG